MDDKEKSELGYKTIVGFFQQFGDDIYAQILMEELFNGVMNEEALFVFGEQGETGDQAGDSSPERICDDNPIDESGLSGPATDVATPDLPDYL